MSDREELVAMRKVLAAVQADLETMKQLLQTFEPVLERGNEVIAAEWQLYWRALGLENRTIH